MSVGYKKLDFLAHVVGDGKLEPSASKIQAILGEERPKTKKEVRRFLGMVGFYRRFISSFAEISACLSDLTRKGKPTKIVWEQEHENMYVKLTSALTNHPVLRNPDFSRRFVLQTDASERGVGAVLQQAFEDGIHPILFLSRKLVPREQNFSTVEKECLAIVWAVQKLREYLLGVEFVIETDHSPLQWLESMKSSNQRLMRWSLALQEYHFTIRHIPGKDNTVADMLSRSFEG